MGGMFQRLDKLRKHAFASACLFGETNNSSISAVWIFKGQQLAFELCDDWQIDYASYAWKKLDPKVGRWKYSIFFVQSLNVGILGLRDEEDC